MSWDEVKLKDLGKIYTGSTPSTTNDSYFGGEFPFITPSELDLNEPIIQTPRTLTQAGVEVSTLIPKDAVMVCCIGSLGKIGIAGRSMVTNQQINSIVFDKAKVDARYGFYACRRLKSKLISIAPATTVPIVNKTRFSELTIPLPSLAEQQRIASILDKADLVKRKRELAIEKLGLLAKNIFFDMFGNPNINNKNLKMQNLGKVLKVKSGNFLPANAMESDGKHAVYGGNGINGYHDLYMFEDKKIVIGRVGAYCGCVHVTQPKSWVTDNALYIEEFSNELNFEYLAFALDIANLNKVSSQSGQPLISGARIYRVNILVPPLEDQAIFIKKLKLIDSHEIRNQKSSCLTKDMVNSLQSQAFSGQL